MDARRFIFTVTTGRSGTRYLSFVLNQLRGVECHHEPEPNFVECMRRAQSDPDVATRFLLTRKLPHLCSQLSKPVYIETSHLNCKGLLSAWKRCENLPSFDLILLRRDPRKVAVSMMQLDTIPGRSERGLKWYLSPDDPSNTTRLSDWTELSEYQLCYWYCLEIERRMEIYANLVEENGGTCASCTVEQVSTWRGLYDLLTALNLPLPSGKGLLRLIKNKHKRINSQSKYKKPLNLDVHYQEAEAEVRQNIKLVDDHLLGFPIKGVHQRAVTS